MNENTESAQAEPSAIEQIEQQAISAEAARGEVHLQTAVQILMDHGDEVEPGTASVYTADVIGRSYAFKVVKALNGQVEVTGDMEAGYHFRILDGIVHVYDGAFKEPVFGFLLQLKDTDKPALMMTHRWVREDFGNPYFPPLYVVDLLEMFASSIRHVLGGVREFAEYGHDFLDLVTQGRQLFQFESVRTPQALADAYYKAIGELIKYQNQVQREHEGLYKQDIQRWAIELGMALPPVNPLALDPNAVHEASNDG